jgi:hypothetical protein
MAIRQKPEEEVMLAPHYLVKFIPLMYLNV